MTTKFDLRQKVWFHNPRTQRVSRAEIRGIEVCVYVTNLDDEPYYCIRDSKGFTFFAFESRLFSSKAKAKAKASTKQHDQETTQSSRR